MAASAERSPDCAALHPGYAAGKFGDTYVLPCRSKPPHHGDPLADDRCVVGEAFAVAGSFLPIPRAHLGSEPGEGPVALPVRTGEVSVHRPETHDLDAHGLDDCAGSAGS